MNLFNYLTKRRVIWTLLGLVFVIIVFYTHDNTEVFVKKISDQCKGITTHERQECLQQNILSYVDKNPTGTSELFTSIWKLLEKGGISDDARIFSPIVHQVGMLLSTKDISLKEAALMCGLGFRGGCTHGFFMERVDDTHEKFDSDAIIKECFVLSDTDNIDSNSFLENCIHGAGHEFAANMKGTLNEALLLCNVLPDSLIDHCVYGVFMEYSKGDAGSGHHSEKPVGRKEFSCSLVDNSFKKVCHISLGFYKQYEVNNELWEDTYRFCQRLANKDREDCWNGIGGALLFSHAFVPERALALCKSLPEDVQNFCIDSL